MTTYLSGISRRCTSIELRTATPLAAVAAHLAAFPHPTILRQTPLGYISIWAAADQRDWLCLHLGALAPTEFYCDLLEAPPGVWIELLINSLPGDVGGVVNTRYAYASIGVPAVFGEAEVLPDGRMRVSGSLYRSSGQHVLACGAFVRGNQPGDGLEALEDALAEYLLTGFGRSAS